VVPTSHPQETLAAAGAGEPITGRDFCDASDQFLVLNIPYFNG